MRRTVLAVFCLALALGAGAGLAGAAAGSSATARLVAFRESTLSQSTRSLKLQLPTTGTSGGVYTTASGDAVRIFAATQYLATNPSFNQGWADFLASAPHGDELSRVTVVLHPLARVQAICGAEALACYSPGSETIVAPADDPAPGLSAASILLHEYGHHVAENRDNEPWAAVDYGPKRWASARNICRKTAEGSLHPGNEGENYQLNPGEAWAETYRVVAESALGLPSTAWEIVSRSFYPDEAALQAASADVLDPWTGNTTQAVTGSLRQAQKLRRVRIATPYDGTFAVGVANRTKTPLTLRLVDGAGTTLATAKAAKGRTGTLRTSICGQRLVQVELRRSVLGTGSYTAAISRP